MVYKMRSFSSLDKVKNELNGLDCMHSSYDPQSWNEHEKMRWHSEQAISSQVERTPSIKKMLQKRSKRKSFFKSLFRSSRPKNFKAENKSPRMKLQMDSTKENQIPLHYIMPNKSMTTMQVVLTSIAYIEQNGGLLSRGIYRDKDGLSLKEVHHCADMMIKGHSINSSEFTKFTDVRIIAAALKSILTTCELVPCNLIPSVMEITDGAEIEELVASPDWDALKGNTFLALLRHLANVARFEVSNDMSSLELGNIFGEILLREQKKYLETHDDKDFSSPKSKGRRIALIIRYMADEGRDQVKNKKSSDNEKWKTHHQSPRSATDTKAHKNSSIAKSSALRKYDKKYGGSKIDKNLHEHNSLEEEKYPQSSEKREHTTNTETTSSLTSSVTDSISEGINAIYDRHDTIVERAQLRLMRAEALLQRPVSNMCGICCYSIEA